MKTRKLYSPLQVLLGSFLGGMIIAIYFVSRNFIALSNKSAARKTIFWGLIAMIFLIELFLEFGFLVPLGIVTFTSIIASKFVEKYQLSHEAIADSPNFECHSNKSVLLITSIFLSLNLLTVYSEKITSYFYVDGRSPQLMDYYAKKGDYSEKGNVIFDISQNQGELFSQNTVSVIEHLSDESWSLPFYGYRTASILQYPYIEVVDNNTRTINFTDSSQKTSTNYLEKLEKLSRNHPVITNRLLDPKAQSTSFEVYFNIEGHDTVNSILKISSAVLALKSAVEEQFNVSIHLRGDYVNSTLKADDRLKFTLPSLGETISPIYDPEYLATLEQLATWLRARSSVKHVYVASDSIKLMNMRLHDNDRLWFRLPETQELSIDYLNSISFPPELHQGKRISHGYPSQSLVDITLNKNAVLADLQQAIADWLAENAPELGFDPKRDMNLSYLDKLY